MKTHESVVRNEVEGADIMTADIKCGQIGTRRPALVFRNLNPGREPQHPATWRLHVKGRGEFKIAISYDANRPRVIHKEAA